VAEKLHNSGAVNAHIVWLSGRILASMRIEMVRTMLFQAFKQASVRAPSVVVIDDLDALCPPPVSPSSLFISFRGCFGFGQLDANISLSM
jgi:hypothetical protein